MSARMLGWMLIHSVWEGGLIAALALAALAVTRKAKPGVRYVICVAALALMIVGPIATAGVWHASGDGQIATVSAATVAAAPTSALVANARYGLDIAIPWLVRIWLAGVLALSIRLLAGLGRTRSLVDEDTQPAAEWITALTGRLMSRLGIHRVVRVLESSRVHVPLVAGWLRPAILLPGSLLTGLTPYQLELILVHELAHIRRHDYVINVCQAVAETLLFYHPVAWWLSARIREEREHCCDDFTLSVCGGSAREYATMLLAIEEWRGEAIGFAAAATGGSLLRRVRRLLGNEPASESTRVRLLVAGVGVALATLLLAGFSMQSARGVSDRALVTQGRVPISVVPMHMEPNGSGVVSRLEATRTRSIPSKRAVSGATAAHDTTVTVGWDSTEVGTAVAAVGSTVDSSTAATVATATTPAMASIPSTLELPSAAVRAQADARVAAALTDIVARSTDMGIDSAALVSLGGLAPSRAALAALEHTVWQMSRPELQYVAMLELRHYRLDRRLRVFLNQVLEEHPSENVRWVAVTLLGGP